VRTTIGKRTLGRTRWRWKENAKRDLRGDRFLGLEVDGSLAQWRALVLDVLNFQAISAPERKNHTEFPYFSVAISKFSTGIKKIKS
jgi:hypothetical protein